MKATFSFTLALVVGVTATSLALAGGEGGPSSGSHSSHGSSSHYQASKNHLTNNVSIHNSNYGSFNKTKNIQNYHLTYGKKLSNGKFYYPGKYQSHWSYCCFNSKFGCYLYWCPCTCGWYYYCTPDCCYYPVCYVPYRCYCWGTPVCYSVAPCPTVDCGLPEPVSCVTPTP
jgi:hypothetical protein